MIEFVVMLCGAVQLTNWFFALPDRIEGKESAARGATNTRDGGMESD